MPSTLLGGGGIDGCEESVRHLVRCARPIEGDVLGGRLNQIILHSQRIQADPKTTIVDSTGDNYIGRQVIRKELEGAVVCNMLNFRFQKDHHRRIMGMQQVFQMALKNSTPCPPHIPNQSRHKKQF